MITPQDWQEALDIQHAWNLSGLVHSMPRMLDAVRSECANTGAVNTHPLVRLWLDKLCELAGLYVVADDAQQSAFQAAYDHGAVWR
jgi:hypothetical protein